MSERRIWNWLRNRTFSGFKFRRQVPISTYIVDFYCAELALAIEVDGRQHELSETDAERTGRLRALGIEVVRIPNVMLAQDPELAWNILHSAIEERVGRRGR